MLWCCIVLLRRVRHFHPDVSVRMIRDYFDDAGVALMGLHVRDLTGLNNRARWIQVQIFGRLSGIFIWRGHFACGVQVFSVVRVSARRARLW